MTDNDNLVGQMFTQINNMINYKMEQQTIIKSAKIQSINQDNTVNITIPPSQTVYHNIQNQSIFQTLNPGDNVKVIIENGNLSSMWIIGAFKSAAYNYNSQDFKNESSSVSDFLLDNNTEQTTEQYNSLNQNIQQIQNTVSIMADTIVKLEKQIADKSNYLDIVYPIGSIYMSTKDVDPKELLGGSWEKIEGKFLFGSDNSYTLGTKGGEAEHTLIESEMPSHIHDSLYWNDQSQCPISLNGDPSPGANHPNGYRLSWATGTPDGAPDEASINTSSAGGSGAHNNMPPFLVVNIWKRTS